MTPRARRRYYRVPPRSQPACARHDRQPALDGGDWTTYRDADYLPEPFWPGIGDWRLWLAGIGAVLGGIACIAWVFTVYGRAAG